MQGITGQGREGYKLNQPTSHLPLSPPKFLNYKLYNQDLRYYPHNVYTVLKVKHMHLCTHVCKDNIHILTSLHTQNQVQTHATVQIITGNLNELDCATDPASLILIKYINTRQETLFESMSTTVGLRCDTENCKGVYPGKSLVWFLPLNITPHLGVPNVVVMWWVCMSCHIL